jgi:hypothetical protein
MRKCVIEPSHDAGELRAVALCRARARTVGVHLGGHSGVTVVLLWCYSGVTVVLQWCYSGATMVL